MTRELTALNELLAKIRAAKVAHLAEADLKTTRASECERFEFEVIGIIGQIEKSAES